MNAKLNWTLQELAETIPQSQRNTSVCFLLLLGPGGVSWTDNTRVKWRERTRVARKRENLDHVTRAQHRTQVPYFKYIISGRSRTASSQSEREKHPPLPLSASCMWPRARSSVRLPGAFPESTFALKLCCASTKKKNGTKKHPCLHLPADVVSRDGFLLLNLLLTGAFF